MSGEVPDGWAVKTVGEIASITMGQSPPSSTVSDDGDGLPFIQGNAEFGARYPKPRQFAADCPKVVEGGDILLSVRAPVGEVNVAPERLCIGRGLAGLRPTEGDHDFLYYALGGLAPVFARLSQGSTFDAINGKDLRSIPLLVPPLDEQRRIAEVLRSVDEAIAANRAVVDQQNGLIGAIFEEWSNQSAPMVALGDILDFKNGINFEKEERADEGTLTLDVMNMFSDDMTPTYEGAYRISKAVPPELLLQQGDVLFVRSSVKQQGVGWTSLADGFVENTTFCGFIIRGRPKRADVLSRYVVGVLRAPKYRRWLIQHSTRSALTNINQKTIASVEMPLPSIEKQQELAEQYDQLAAAAFDSGVSLAKLEKLRAVLANDLLSGRVRVPA